MSFEHQTTSTLELPPRQSARPWQVATIIAVVVTIGLLVLYASASAEASRTYMACDNPSSPDYAKLNPAPRSCYLGLEESPYQAQRVPGHRVPPAVLLSNLHWTHWGQFTATATGRSCGPGESGEAECSPVVVKDSRPQAILPAGGLVIYELMRVFYSEFTDWYRPGVDY
jgi:hypothetical protein